MAYGRFARTPKWPLGRTFTLGFCANIAGLFFGQARRLFAHVQFVRSLDDSPRFANVLRDIAKQDGVKLNWTGSPDRPESENTPKDASDPTVTDWVANTTQTTPSSRAAEVPSGEYGLIPTKHANQCIQWHK